MEKPPHLRLIRNGEEVEEAEEIEIQDSLQKPKTFREWLLWKGVVPKDIVVTILTFIILAIQILLFCIVIFAS